MHPYRNIETNDQQIIDITENNDKLLTYLTGEKLKYLKTLSKTSFGLKLFCEQKYTNLPKFKVLELPVSSSYRRVLQGLEKIPSVNVYEKHFQINTTNIGMESDYFHKKEYFEIVQKDFLYGTSLLKVHHNFSKRERYEVIDSLFETVSLIHKEGIAGIDICRSNILISEGRPWIFDLNIYFQEGIFGPLFNELKDLDFKDIETLFDENKITSYSAEKLYWFSEELRNDLNN